MSKLLVETIEGVRTLIFNRPETKNAFDAELWGLFRDALNSASDDPDISSVVVTGSSNTFSSGVDLSSMMGDGGAPPSPIMLLKSTPDEKVFEDPVTTTEEISGSSLAEFNASLKRPHNSASNAFFVSGRLNIRVRTPSMVSTRSLLTFL